MNVDIMAVSIIKKLDNKLNTSFLRTYDVATHIYK